MTRYDRYGLSAEQQQQQKQQSRPVEGVTQHQQHQHEQREEREERPAREEEAPVAATCAAMTDDESLLVDRANAEREEIFLRYERRGCKATDDSWQDVDELQVYAQVDRYGFVYQAGALLPEAGEEHEKLLKLEMARVKKWVKMHQNWHGAVTHKNLRRRVMKGIPDRMRSAIWRQLLDLDRVMQENRGVYERMLRIARERSPDIRQIDFDVNRQFRNNIFYRERYSVKQQSLFRVLAAYSMYNTEIGYCQGMSTVAAVLLMYFDEEDTFWALEILMVNARYAMHGLYIVGFPKLMRFLAHHDKILTKCLPKLKKHLDKREVHSVLYSLKWFFVIFLERIPFSLCLRVWDIYMMFGERVLTAMAFTILKLHCAKLLRMKDMDQITDYLMTSLHKQFGFSDDTVIKTLQSSMDELKRLKLLNLPPAAASELPTQARGQPHEPSTKAKIGHRGEQFSEREMDLKKKVLYRSGSKNDEDEQGEKYRNGGVRGHGDGTADGTEEDDDERTEKDCDDITEDTVSHLNIVSDIDGGSITKHSLTGTSVTSTNDISLTSYDRTCDMFRLPPSHRNGREPAAVATSAVLMLDQLAAQLSDEELSSYGAAVELILDSEPADPVVEAPPVVNGCNGVANGTFPPLPPPSVDEEGSLELAHRTEPTEMQRENSVESVHEIQGTVTIIADEVAGLTAEQAPNDDEEDEDELTEKQLSF